MTDDNGRIKLTWPQVAWGMAVLVAIVGGWYDLRYQVRILVATISAHEVRLGVLEERNRNTGFTRQDAEELRAEIAKAVKRKP